MKGILVCFLVLASAFMLSLAGAQSGQESTSKPAVKKPPATAKSKGTESRPDEGTVTDGLYSEHFFLLRYAVPQGWVVRTPEMRKELPGQENAILLLSTFAKAAPTQGEINPSISITAESAAASPEIKTPADYLESITELVASKGFTVLNPPGEITIGGVNLLRGDFQKQEGDQVTYQATMVAFRRGYILQITAITGNEEQLTPLLNRLQITAPPTLKKP
jgi:hypothetical protein